MSKWLLQINGKDVDLVAAMADGIAPFFLFPPVFTAIVTGTRSITQLNEDEFLDKLQLFLAETDVEADIKNDFLVRLDKDAEEFFKRIVKVLDRMEDKEKATIVGKLFKALITNKIERIDDFNKLATVVMNCYIGSIKYLLEFREDVGQDENGQKIYPMITTDELEAQELVAAGILTRRSKYAAQVDASSSEGSPVREKVIYNFSYLGVFLYEYGLK